MAKQGLESGGLKRYWESVLLLSISIVFVQTPIQSAKFRRRCSSPVSTSAERRIRCRIDYILTQFSRFGYNSLGGRSNRNFRNELGIRTASKDPGRSSHASSKSKQCNYSCCSSPYCGSNRPLICVVESDT